MQLSAGGWSFSWKFLQADVAVPIIGADFLANFKMAVDLSGMQLLCPVGLKILLEVPRAGSLTVMAIGVVGTLSSPSLPTVEALPSLPTFPTVEALGERAPAVVAVAQCRASKCSLAAKEVASVNLEVEQLTADYPSVVNASKKLPKAKNQVKHVIETMCLHPVKAHDRCLDKDKLAAKAEFLAMEQQGIVRHSKSSWASPLHMVRKKDDTWRPCGDYRQLNLANKPGLCILVAISL